MNGQLTNEQAVTEPRVAVSALQMCAVHVLIKFQVAAELFPPAGSSSRRRPFTAAYSVSSSGSLPAASRSADTIRQYPAVTA